LLQLIDKNINGISKLKFSTDFVIQTFLAQFLQKRYNGYKIYAHKLGMLDAVYILSDLVAL